MTENTPIEKMCTFLDFRALPKSTKKCAEVVRQAVEFGLGKNIVRTLSAKNYGPSYERAGFKKIFCSPESPKDQYQPQKGDVAIIQYEPHGHICAFTGKNWISDFVQRDMYGGPIRDKDPAFAIYRLVI